MKATIDRNGSSATVRRVQYGLDGNSRIKFLIDLKEKYQARNYMLGQGAGEITIDFTRHYLRSQEDGDYTRVTLVAETDAERYFFSEWILLEDLGKNELRLWLVAPVCDECELVLFSEEED